MLPSEVLDAPGEQGTHFCNGYLGIQQIVTREIIDR
jgi:hypothetical protein